MIYKVVYQYDEGMLPDADSVNVSQLHAEMDLWATRYNMAKIALKLADSVSNEIEKFDHSVNVLADAIEKVMRWNRAVNKIRAKYEKAKTDYENYFTELKVQV